MPTCCSKICHDFLCVLGLVSTVANLRGYWLLLDNFLLHDNFIFTVVVLGVVGFSSLTLLKMLSSLHGGVVMINDYSRPSLFPSWILTYWLIKVRFLLTSLEDLGAATCKLVNFVDHKVQSFRSPLKILQKSCRSPAEDLQRSFRSPSKIL